MLLIATISCAESGSIWQPGKFHSKVDNMLLVTGTVAGVEQVSIDLVSARLLPGSLVTLDVYETFWGVERNQVSFITLNSLYLQDGVLMKAEMEGYDWFKPGDRVIVHLVPQEAARGGRYKVSFTRFLESALDNYDQPVLIDHAQIATPPKSNPPEDLTSLIEHCFTASKQTLMGAIDEICSYYEEQ
jgi:hypothetical protein